MDTKPVIGIMARDSEHAAPYVDVMKRSEGEPWVILPGHDQPPSNTLSRVGALVVCGAGDADGRRGGLSLNGAGHGVEWGLLLAALDANLPMLCISQGMQTLNLALGGRPVQDVPGHESQEQDGEQTSAYHRIYISPGSKLAAVVGAGGFVRVNSRHRQGLHEAQRSPALMASAYSLEDGVIEALESPEHRLVIGVQFHPERLMEVPPHFLRLFQSLVDRAREQPESY